MSVWVNASEYYGPSVFGLGRRLPIPSNSTLLCVHGARQAAVHTLELYSTVCTVLAGGSSYPPTLTLLCTVLGRWLFIPSYSDSTVYGARQVALHTLLL